MSSPLFVLSALLLLLLLFPALTTASVLSALFPKNSGVLLYGNGNNLTLDSSPLLVRTEFGAIRGALNRNLSHTIRSWLQIHKGDEQYSRRFAGIPYAAKPVGDLRFNATQPWTQAWGKVDQEGRIQGKVLNTTVFPPACPQNFITTADQSEDCLYLNVFTPPTQKITRPLPVLVWLYGGAFYFGDSYITGMYNPRFLTDAKDVIIVTLNYRVGSFGFFASPETGSNFGILDQREALGWIQRNIRGFGGDPNRITVYGNSAGATSISLHLTSPTTPPGLFHRAIHMSGPLGTEIRSKEAMHKESRNMAGALGCLTPRGHADLQCLRSRSMEEILDATRNVTIDYPERGPLNNRTSDGANHLIEEVGEQYHWWPSIDDHHIIGQPRDLLRSPGPTLRVPTIFGVQEGETGLWIMGDDIVPQGLTRLRQMYDSVAHTRHYQSLFGPDVDRVLSMYPVSNSFQENIRSALDLTTDVAFRCPTEEASQSMARHGVPTYLYQMTQHSFPRLGHCRHIACHGNELPYLWKTWFRLGRKGKILQRQILAYFIHFAETGDPNPPESETYTSNHLSKRWTGRKLKEKSPLYLPHWPRVQPEGVIQHLCLGNTVEVRGWMRPKICPYWNGELKRLTGQDMVITINDDMETNVQEEDREMSK
ncbi:MAG: Carboxylesterase family-domain-containing protein [Piptocephalis tieghemiana]|nr:MAG: Carboxylesterase family-domain-containing protein [Piptocephalis tieghemiana]